MTDDFFTPVQASQDDFFVPLSKEEQVSLQQDETTPEYVGRTAARTAARIAETPVEMIKSLSQLPEAVFKGPLGQKIVEALKPFAGIGQLLPETEEIRKLEKEYTGEYLQPMTPGEGIYDELVQDTTSLFLGPTGKAPFLTKLGRNIAISTAGLGAKNVTEELGGGDKAQAYAKLGTMLLASMWNPGGAEKYASSLYKKAEEVLPEGASGDAKLLEQNLKNLNKKVSRGTLAESEKAIKNETEALLGKIQNDKLSYEEAVASKRSLNEKAAKVFFETPEKGAKGRARKLFGEIKENLNKFVKTAETEYPEFYKNQRMADEAFGTIAQSKKLGGFFKKHGNTIKTIGIPSGIYHLFSSGIPGIAKAASAVGIGAATYKTGQILHQIAKSPTLRKYYFNTLNAATQENIGAVVKNMRAFQKEVENDQEFFKLIEE